MMAFVRSTRFIGVGLVVGALLQLPLLLGLGATRVAVLQAVAGVLGLAWSAAGFASGACRPRKGE